MKTILWHDFHGMTVWCEYYLWVTSYRQH